MTKPVRCVRPWNTEHCGIMHPRSGGDIAVLFTRVSLQNVFCTYLNDLTFNGLGAAEETLRTVQCMAPDMIWIIEHRRKKRCVSEKWSILIKYFAIQMRGRYSKDCLFVVIDVFFQGSKNPLRDLFLIFLLPNSHCLV